MGRVASTLQSFPSIVAAASLISVGPDESSAYEMGGNTDPYGYTHVSHVFPFSTCIRHRQGPPGRVEKKEEWYCDSK